LSGNPRIYIFDECHKQLKDSQEAFLKFLEEPPENVYSILCTTNPERLLPTIISRCSSFQFKTLKLSEIPLLLNSILEKEGFDSEEYPLEIKKEIARLSEGRPRDALKLLDAVIDMTDENEILEALTTVSLSEANIKELCQLLLEGKTWDFIRKQVMSLILDNAPEDVRLGIIFYMQKVLWNSAKNDRANYIIEIFSDPTYASGKPYLTSMFYRVCQK
jgi:DNA polymerase-3 subunit gamma/tau